MVFAENVDSQNVTNFQSTGVYFKNMGELLVEEDSLTVSTFIDLEQYHKAIEVVKNASFLFRTRCVRLKINCEKEYTELMTSHNDLEAKLNSVYGILLRPAAQRKKRFVGIITGLIGIAFGIGNSIQAHNLAKDVESMKIYMRYNFDDIKKALKLQGEFQTELNKQQHHLSGILNVHEKKIIEIEERIGRLEESTSELRKDVEQIRMTVIFQGIKLDVLTILGKLRELEQWMLDLQKNVFHPEIMTPEYITEVMTKHSLISGKFLADPILTNYNYITETIIGSAFVMPDLKKIFVNLKIPIYQEQKLSLYEIIEVPVIKDRKILRIANNYAKYCVITEDTSQYDCNSDNAFIKGKHFYFSASVTDVSLLSTANSGLCIIDIFIQSSAINETCRYKAVSQNLEIVKEIDTNKFLFAFRDQTKYTLECKTQPEDGSVIHYNNIDKHEYLQDTGILYLGSNCVFTTEMFETRKTTSSKVFNKWEELDVYNFEDLHESIDEIMKKARFPKRLGNEKMKTNFEDMQRL